MSSSPASAYTPQAARAPSRCQFFATYPSTETPSFLHTRKVGNSRWSFHRKLHLYSKTRLYLWNRRKIDRQPQGKRQIIVKFEYSNVSSAILSQPHNIFNSILIFLKIILVLNLSLTYSSFSIKMFWYNTENEYRWIFIHFLHSSFALASLLTIPQEFLKALWHISTSIPITFLFYC